MGKSDPFVFNWYRQQLPATAGAIAFLGFPGPNEFTDTFSAPIKHYFDLVKGWDINSTWNILPGAYDLVICTRCACFSSDPAEFVKKALAITKKGGIFFADWGLGDHWRFPTFKVGWTRAGERERVQYGTHTSMLCSCFWDDSLEQDSNVKAFRQAIGRFGYDYNLTVGDIVRQEVPAILRMNSQGPARISTMFLWPEAPQLYISTLYQKDFV